MQRHSTISVASLAVLLASISLLRVAGADEGSTNPGLTIAGKVAGDVSEFTDLKVPFCWCPAGKFRMGSTDNDSESRFTEPRAVDVQLTHGFWIARTEVTQEFYNAVEKDVDRPAPWVKKPWRGEVPDVPAKPAANISWEYANQFCADLNDREKKANRLPGGWRYSLPTAAEWEYACRAGTSTRYTFGDDDKDLALYAWYQNEDDKALGDIPRDVGKKKANAWGLFDMHGNVAEWTLDVESSTLPGGSNPVSKVPQIDFTTQCILKGGSFIDKAGSCRSATIDAEYTQNAFPWYGFRIVLRQDAASNE